MHDKPLGEPEIPAATPVSKPSVRHRVVARLRNYLIAGVLVTAPLGLTIYFALGFINWMDDTVMPLVPLRYHPETYLPFSIPGLGLVIVLAGLILIGLTAASLIGRTTVHLSERILHRMPVVRGIYITLKQVFETVLSNQSQAFRQVVLIEYPRRGIWVIGFSTGTSVGEVQDKTKERLINVFIPTTPNPTSGFLLFVPEQDVVALDMTVEDGIKLVVSGGIVFPSDKQGKPAAPAVTKPIAAMNRETENALPRG